MADFGSFEGRLKGKGFEPNHAEFGQHIRSEVARRPAMAIARQIAVEANTIAPFDPDSGNVEHLRGSYGARRAGVLRVGRNTRAIAEVRTTAPSAAPNEFGNKHMKPRHVLFRAAFRVLRRQGFSVEDMRKGG